MKIQPIEYDKLPRLSGEPGPKTADMVFREVPFPLRLSWEPSKVVQVIYTNIMIADATVEAFADILEYYGRTWITDHNLDLYGGCFNPRRSRGSSKWSVHSWGLAIDYLPDLGPFGKPAMTPAPVVQAFKDRGFLWGGDWEHPDGMHFSGVLE